MQTKQLHGLSTSSCASGHPCTSQRWRESWDWPQRRTLPLVALYQQGSLSITLPGMLGAPPVLFRTPIPSWGEIACRNCLFLVKKKKKHPLRLSKLLLLGGEMQELYFCVAFSWYPKAVLFPFSITQSSHVVASCIISRAHSCNQQGEERKRSLQSLIQMESECPQLIIDTDSKTMQQKKGNLFQQMILESKLNIHGRKRAQA